MNEVNLITMKTETVQTHSDYVAYCEDKGRLTVDPLLNEREYGVSDIEYAKVNQVVEFARLDNKGSSKYLKNREYLGSQGYSLESDTFDSLTNSWTLKKTTLYASSEETKKAC